ncbi:MAG TPA: hypothetical protein VNA24_00845 [Hyalangium sp.]|jgi:hypothetical protein|nr:hypothetical protein [Hyalangium sp.]
MRARLLLPLLLATGCALDAGEGFAVLQPSLRAAYTSTASREVGDGYQRLASDFQMRLTTAKLRLERIDLLGSSGGGGPTSFDPANPPPGYTICHNGHCDREDGAQVPYEEVEAELGGGGATASTVATLPVGELDLLAPETRSLECQPDCELPNTTVSNGRWTLTALQLDGTVRDSRASPRFAGERPFRLELTPTGAQTEPVAVLTGALDIPSDREHAPRVVLDLTLELTPASFDPVDWAAATPGSDGTVDLNHPDNIATRTQLLEELGELAPQAEVKREDR